MDLEIRSGWPLALAELGCMGDDLLGDDCHIDGCQAWGAGEDQDTKAEKLTYERRGDDAG
jgi:hypothetical protein